MNAYTTLARVRAHLSLDLSIGAASADAELNPLLHRFILDASRAIDRYTRRRFTPRYETRYYDLGYSRKVILDDDLLALSKLATQNGACTVASEVLWLAAGRNWNRTPADRLVIDDSSGSVLNYSGTPQRANEVTGWWGYHEDYAHAWVNTGTSLHASYNQGTSSLTLAGAGSVGTDASDINYEHPRIAVGDLLKIADTYFYVTGGAASSNGCALVIPGVNGTSAAANPAGTSIAKWAPERDIEWSCRRLVTWMIGEQAQPYNPRQGNRFTGEWSAPDSWPSPVRDRLDRYVKNEFEVIPG